MPTNTNSNDPNDSISNTSHPYSPSRSPPSTHSSNSPKALPKSSFTITFHTTHPQQPLQPPLLPSPTSSSHPPLSPCPVPSTSPAPQSSAA
ncbi:uncharacterized protein BO96DRAFT_493062 [Aspergillus niger CBS 101883]|uniref:uncharacterized protein n=1 Tax=Aspergillus lacticoffeatus (strain CBS 101883) TaxID=1450533 RepID=UPI000D7F4F69|nr:uncharacterized protein BO96DRAFT_493062 [Aspergillus niger CBS 101883]PYH58056.1 hypothetical protein BO96DRAFT_493062 [Aspergillus niger CBS 101883]